MKKRRILSVVLALLLCVGMLPLNAFAAQTTVEIAGYVISGEGIVSGEDVSVSGSILTVHTSKEIIISNKSPDTPNQVGIEIPGGKKANITLSGVNIKTNGASPINVAKGGELNLVLADGSVNTLTGKGIWPGLHCGSGAALIIDDEMDSENPGKLVAVCEGHSAAIGGLPREDGGSMTFNGGIVNATVNDTYDSFGGAGIGGGCNAAGTSPTQFITINGGVITARASYHGAGIGGGWNSNKPPAVPSGVTASTHSCGPGNITVNGGTVYTYGKGHGNAFGSGCYGQKKNLNNSIYTMKFTGGTFLPTAPQAADTKTFDIGGMGYNSSGTATRAMSAKVIVSGGSVRLSYPSKIDCKIYSADQITETFMVKIDLSGEADSLKDAVLTDMKLLVDGVVTNYGLPASVDENGYFYLLLPKTAQNSEIEVILTFKDSNGNTITMDPFNNSSATQGAFLKRYITFTIHEGALGSPEAMRKIYDGLPFANPDISNAGIVAGTDNKPINDNDKVTYTSQRVESDDTLIDEPITVGMPVNVGKWMITVASSQYSNSPEFENSYWGHKGTYGYYYIEKASSSMSISVSDKEVLAINPVVLTANVRPAADMAKTCNAPRGKVQFYINGIPVGEPVELADTKTTTTDGFAQSQAVFEWTPINDRLPFADEYEVTAEYLGGENSNYNPCSGTADVNIEKIQRQDPTEAQAEDVKVYYVPDIDNKQEIVNGSLEILFTNDKFCLEGFGGITQEPFIYKSEDLSVAEIDSATGEVTLKDFGEVNITVTRPGDAAYADETKTVSIKVNPISPQMAINKTAKNITDPGKPTQVGDVITYTVNVKNEKIGSLWKEVCIKDLIAEGLILDTDSVYLKKSGEASTKLDGVADGEGDAQLGAYKYGSDGMLSVFLGDIKGGQEYELTFSVKVSEGVLGDEINAPVDIINKAKAQGKDPVDSSVKEIESSSVYPSEDDKPENGGVDPEFYTVTFNANGGTVSPESAKANSNGNLSSLPMPTKIGYIFEGWYDINGADITLNTVFEKDTEITAMWTKCTHENSTEKPDCENSAICSLCGDEIPALSHNFNGDWINTDELGHYRQCADCEAVDVQNKLKHEYDNELDETCNICDFVRVIVINTSAVNVGKTWIGNPIGKTELSGTVSGVSGTFKWKNPNETVTENGSYTAIFTPDDNKTAPVEIEIFVEAKPCDCLCHDENPFVKFINDIFYAICSFFGVNRHCCCENVHYDSYMWKPITDFIKNLFN